MFELKTTVDFGVFFFPFVLCPSVRDGVNMICYIMLQINSLFRFMSLFDCK